jgi:cation transport ATPase
MDAFKIFLSSAGGLLLILILLVVIPQFVSFLKKMKKKRKVKKEKIEVKGVVNKKKIEEKEAVKVTKKNLFRALIIPFFLVVLLGLFLVFESQVVNFVKGYAIELLPVNYVSLFILLGLIFVINGLILDLKSQKKNNNFKSFVWIIHGLVFSMVALFYDFLNLTHVVLFGMRFSWLLVLLAGWELVILIGVFSGYRKIF